MKQYNFNAPQYGSFGQRQDKYIEGLKQGVGTLARTPVNAYNAWKTEENDKRKWDNLLEQQKYQRARDAIADERYNVEQSRIEEELRRQQEERQARYNAMMANKAFMRQRYGVGDYEAQDRELERYGDGAVMAAAMMENASNPEDYIASYNYLMSVISQHNQAEQSRQEIEREKAVARADDQLSSNIVLHPVMSEVSRIAAGAPLMNYTVQDVSSMISTLQELERHAMNIGDNSKRMEVMSKINNAYGKLEEIYGRKTAPVAKRK